MTKVQLRYDLMRPMDEAMMEQISRVHGVYGMVRVRPNDTMDELIRRLRCIALERVGSGNRAAPGRAADRAARLASDLDGDSTNF